MNVWLLTIGEPVPVQEGGRDRLHRTGYFAHFLADQGHRVTWWTSTFDHFRKAHRFSDDTTVQSGDRLTIRLLHGRGYARNVSLSRILDHQEIARKFALMSRQTEKPDVIVAALPTIELCLDAVRYGREHSVPVVLDMRDMWPDIFVDLAPPPLRPPMRWLLGSMFTAAREACAGATAITGITDAFVDWGLSRGQRQRSELDRSFPLGYVSAPPSPDAIAEAEAKWDALGFRAGHEDFVACFFGTLGRQFDIETILRASKALAGAGKPLRILLCGGGDRLEHYRALAANDPNVYFPGWVNAAEIYVMMRRASVGLDPLPDRYDFLSTINNKAIEYLSAGLPVIASPDRGVLHELIREEDCGFSYRCGDAEGLANLLAELIADPGKLGVVSRNAEHVFREKFTAEKVYGEMMAYLQDLVGGGSSCGK